MTKKIKGYSHFWTQPYIGFEIYNMNSKVETFNELARIDFLEDEIREMTSYPDAEQIINKIKGKDNGTLG